MPRESPLSTCVRGGEAYATTLLAPDDRLLGELRERPAHGNQADASLHRELRLGRQLGAGLESALIDILQDERDRLFVEGSHGARCVNRLRGATTGQDG